MKIKSGTEFDLPTIINYIFVVDICIKPVKYTSLKVLLVNLNSDQSGRLKETLNVYHIQSAISHCDFPWDQADLLMPAEIFQVCIIYTDNSAVTFSRLLHKCQINKTNMRFVFLLSDENRVLAMELLKMGAAGILYESDLYSQASAEKILPLCLDLKRQKLYLESERFSYIAKAVRYYSHEIRNPLTNISLSSSELKNEIPAGNPVAAKLLQFIEKNSMRINGLLNDAVSLLETSEPHFEEVGLEKVFEEAIDSLNESMDKKQIMLVIDDSARLSIWADREKLVNAVVHILRNSIEACHSTGGAIHINTIKQEKTVLICISDNGKGINSIHLPYIFKPFYSVNQRSRSLGLAAALELIRIQGGSIQITSKAGLETMVCIEMPVVHL